MLKYLATPPRSNQLAGLLEPPIDEVCLEHAALARTGTLSTEALRAALVRVKAAGRRALLSWDILADDRVLADGAALVRQLPLAELDAIRVQDVGVAAYVRSQFPDLPLHLILETGNHNRTGIEAWCRELSPERVVLSNELPLAEINEIAAAVTAEVEIAVLGRLLIFYSPRGLLGADTNLEGTRRRFAVEVEDRKNFPVLENRHGTFMYYEKDLNILPWLEEVQTSNIDWVRLDFKFFEDDVANAARRFLHSREREDLADLKQLMSPRQTRGFFKSNRTDKQFEKLVNPNLRVREDQTLVATVLESAKKEGYTALKTECPLRAGDILEYIIPEGDVLQHRISWLRPVGGEKIAESAEAGLYLIDHMRKASSGTRCYHG